jgi:hypothetical protein
MKKRHDTPKSHTQQRKFKTYPIAMSGVLDSSLLPSDIATRPPTTPWVVAYRVPFYDRLEGVLAQHDVQLTVVRNGAPPRMAGRGDFSGERWARDVATSWLTPGGREIPRRRIASLMRDLQPDLVVGSKLSTTLRPTVPLAACVGSIAGGKLPALSSGRAERGVFLTLSEREEIARAWIGQGSKRCPGLMGVPPPRPQSTRHATADFG